MKRIKVHDKYFKLYMSNQQIEESIQNVADKLNISQSYISRLEKKIIKKLQNKLKV